MSVWTDSLRWETAGRRSRPEQTNPVGARFAASKTNVCPFRSSTFQHQRAKYKFPAAARELRGLSSTAGTRIRRADERSSHTNGAAPTGFGRQPKLKRGLERGLPAGGPSGPAWLVL